VDGGVWGKRKKGCLSLSISSFAHLSRCWPMGPATAGKRSANEVSKKKKEQADHVTERKEKKTKSGAKTSSKQYQVSQRKREAQQNKEV